MNKKTQTIILIVTSILAIGGIGYFIYSKQQEKKMAKIYQESIDEMTKKYGNEIFN